MFPKRKGVTFCHNHLPVGKVCPEELLHHDKRLGGRYDGGILIYVHEIGNISRMVRLHVLYDQIIGLAGTCSSFDVIQPFVGKTCIDRVHDGYLLIQDYIGIIGHAVLYHILSLEQVYGVVIDADIFNII